MARTQDTQNLKLIIYSQYRTQVHRSTVELPIYVAMYIAIYMRIYIYGLCYMQENILVIL